MVADGEVQGYLDLSREWLDAAESSLEKGSHHVAYANLLHALELGVKAALAAGLDDVPRTHNIGGEFGRLYRERVGSDVTRQVNAILRKYDGPRYPDWPLPAPEELREEFAFVHRFLHETIPSIVGEGSP